MLEEHVNEKENMPPSRKLSISRSQKPHEVTSSRRFAISENDKAQDDNEGLNGDCMRVEKAKEIESIIVSDSEEESDEGARPLRSRLSFMRNQKTGRLHKS